MSKQIEIILDKKKSTVSEESLISMNRNFKAVIYIARALKRPVYSSEVNLALQRISIVLGGVPWQDIPYKKLIDNMRLIDESIRAVKSFRTKSQLSLFEK